MDVYQLFESSPTAAWANLVVSLIMFCVFLFCTFQCVRFTIKRIRRSEQVPQDNKVLYYILVGFFSISASQYFVQSPFLNLNSVYLVIKTLLIINIVVFIHEMGHYLAARAFRVNVEDFSIGMGPKLFGFTRKNTTFNLRALPTGGYVKPNQEDAKQLKLVPKLIFLLSGIFLNIVSFILTFAFLSTKGFWSGVTNAVSKLPDVFMNFMNINWSDVYSPERNLVGQWGEMASLSQMAENSLATFATFSLLLGIINLLPIPILDGGRVTLALLEKFFLIAGVRKEWVEKGTQALLLVGLLLIASPMIINNLWSAGAGIGLNLIETILWYALFISIIMNIIIFITDRKNRNVNAR